MSSKKKILDKLQDKPVALIHELPEANNFDSEIPDNLPGHFSNMVSSAGGQLIHANQRESPTIVNELFPESKLSVFHTNDISTVNTIGEQDLKEIEVAVLYSELAVAENGAVWLQDEQISRRILPFIAKHLVISIHSGNIVWNMHQAYERINGIKGFGVFISGPSKTADIEQSLVIGAHGPVSLTIILFSSM